jgi:LCP family protein required for cell wall assembly
MTSALGLFSFLRRFVIALVIVCLLAAGAVALGNHQGRQEFNQRHVVQIGSGILTPQRPAQPANYLLIGHDATGNSDTMMVVHVDPAKPTPLVVSFPRDLMVNIPGHGEGQLNSAIGIGGPSLLIQTFKSYFNVPISHFLQVDFSTFPEIIGAIGKVNVWFPTPVHDPYIGLDVEQSGCVSLDGTSALAYVRSRHYYVPKDLTHPAPWHWNYAPNIPASRSRGGEGWVALGSDVERIPRQQYFLRTVAQTAISRTDDNPTRILGLVSAVMKHLTTDQTLTYNELTALVRTFHKVQPRSVEMTTIPWTTDPANPSRVVVRYPDAQGLLFRLASFTAQKPFLPPLANPATVRVRVVNGSGIPNLGNVALTQFVQAGFRAAGPVDDVTGAPYARTQVRWGADKEVQGITVEYATGSKHAGQAAKATDTTGVDVLVVVGRDWNNLSHHFPSPSPKSKATPPRSTSATTVAPGSTGAASTTTSTTIPAYEKNYIPVDPKTGGVLVGCPKT